MVKQTKDDLQEKSVSKMSDPRVKLFMSLDQTQNVVSHAVNLELKQYKTNISQMKIITMIARQGSGEVTLDELAKWTVRELNSVLNMVNKLEQRGLVKKLKRGSRGKTYISLTDEGLRVFSEEITENSIHLIFDSLSLEEGKQLMALLKKVRDRTRDLLGIDYRPPFLP